MAFPLLDNVVQLQPGQPKELHFTDHAFGPVVMPDPIVGIERPVETLTFVVDLEDGRPVNKVYYVTADRHARDFGPYLAERTYRDYTWTMTVRGEGLGRIFTTVRLPRQPAAP
jgi:hypothetical protein